MRIVTLFCLAAIMLLNSCKRETKNEIRTGGGGGGGGSDCNTSCISPESIAIRHNAMLSYVDNNMMASDTVTGTIYNAESNLIKGYFNSNPLCGGYDSTIIPTGVATTNNYYLGVQTDNGGTFSSVSAALRLADTAESRLDAIRSLDTTAISTKESNFIKDILDSIRTKESNGATDQFGSLSQALTTTWKSKNFDTCNNQGYVSKIMIRLMDSSYNYWNRYPYGVHGRGQALPLWVGLDIVGAVCGALGSIIGDLVHHRALDFVGAGAQALVWGAGASLPGTRWFLNLFK